MIFRDGRSFSIYDSAMSRLSTTTMPALIAQLGSQDRAKGYLVLFLIAGTILLLFLLVLAAAVDFVRKYKGRPNKRLP